jgi:hypothetical protein
MNEQTRRQILSALHSLKNDAAHAWDLMLGADTSGIKAVGDSYKNLEKLIIQLDVEK